MRINHKNNFKVLSLFSGIGGLDLGFHWEGFDIVWASDISEHATQTYRLNFGLDAVCKDITDIPISELPDSDVIIGGPPCQSFSLMGKRDLDDPRGKLVFRFFEIIKYKKPRAFVMENVPGMAASRIDGKRVPHLLKEKYEELGYKVQLLKLTATDFLVPQLRKRLFLIGFEDRIPSVPDGMLFASECFGINYTDYELSAKAAIGDLGICTEKGIRAKYGCEPHSTFAHLMRSANLSDISLHECPRMSTTDRLLVEHIPPGGNYMDIPDKIAPGRVLKYKQTGGRTTTYGRLHPSRPSYTINTYFRRPNVGCNFHYEYPRLITPREAMRFQSIPDHFELIFSNQDGRNALIGNAVPPLMARAIAWSLKNDLLGEKKTSLQFDSAVQLSFPHYET